MLLSSLISALALNACFVKATFHPTHHRHSPHASAVGTSLSTHFDVSVGTIDRYKPTFTQACQEKKTDVLIHGLADIKASISVLGSADGLAQVDVKILSSKVLNLMVKLQAILKIIDEHKLTSSCTSAIVDLKASIQVMISVLASQHMDVAAKCTSAGVDLDFYARVGIKIDVNAKVDLNVGVGAGAGVNTGANVDASNKVIANLKASISVTEGLEPKFKTACEKKNVDVVVNGLATIKTSISVLGTDADAFAHIDADALSTHVVSLFVKIQVLLRLISDNKLSAQCQSAIVSLQGPLQAMVSIAASAGVDVSAKISAAVDVKLFAQVGLNLPIDANVAAGVGAGVGSGVGAGTGTGAGVNADVSTKVVADLQDAISVTADIQPKFKSACEKKDVGAVVSSLATVRASILSLGTHVNVFAKVDANVLNTNVVSLFVKLQVLLRFISDNNLSSQCQGAIISLQAPLKSIVASVGVDVSAKIAAAVDVNLFAKVGLDAVIHANVAGGFGAGVGSGSGPGIGGIVGTGSGTGVHADVSAKVVTDLHASTSLMHDLEPKFKSASESKNVDVIINGLASIKTSIAALGPSSDVYAKVDAEILTTNVLGLFVKLQVLLRIISDSKMGPSCKDSIVSLQAPLKAMISSVASVGINISAKIAAAVDVNLFTQIGLSIGVNAAVNAGTGFGAGVGTGAGAGAGVGVGADASAKVFADFKASTGAVVTLAPTFKTACEQKNVAVLNQGLVSIVASVASVGAHADVLAHVSVDALCTQYFDLLIKLQILLKIIDSHSLTSSCKGSIVSLSLPLKALLKVLVSIGVDVSAKAKAYASLDLGFFANVGVKLDINAGASIGP